MEAYGQAGGAIQSRRLLFEAAQGADNKATGVFSAPYVQDMC